MGKAMMDHEEADAAAVNKESSKTAPAYEVNVSLSAAPLAPLANAIDAAGTTPGVAPLAAAEVSESRGAVVSMPVNEGDALPPEEEAGLLENMESADGAASEKAVLLSAHWRLIRAFSWTCIWTWIWVWTWIEASGRRQRTRLSVTARQQGDASCSAKC